MALKPFDCRLGPQPPQGKVHFVHVKDPAGDGGPGAHVEQAEQPTRLKRRQHIVEMIAQAVVESEEDAGGGRAALSPADEGVAVDEAIVACEIVELALEIGEAQIGKVRKPVCAPAAHSDTSPASRPTLLRIE